MKTLLITGASKGIGLETARLFIDNGYRAINISRTAPPDDRSESHPIDLVSSEADARLAEVLGTVEAGEITLVHNAASMINDSARDADTEAFRRVMDLNVTAPQILNQAVIPKMGAGSSILYIGSTLSEKAVANTFSYVTSKHAIIGMMRATCQDFAGSGIHTACICPGFTDTEMLRIHVGEDEAVLDSIAGLCTFNRLIAPAEIASTIYFAATNPVINGSVIHANLGQVES